MNDQIKTIRNPVPRDNVRSYLITFLDGSSKEVRAVGGTNAWFMAKNIWSDAQVFSVRELMEDENPS